MPDAGTESQLRVFLSADLAGSTQLKNHLNHQELHEKYRARQNVLEQIRKKSTATFSDSDGQIAVLESLGVSSEDFDWAMVVASFYRSLHGEFSANCTKLKEEHSLTNFPVNPLPWKAVGDELIYQFRVGARKELYWITVAFLAAVRLIDKQRGGAEHGLRIKGSAWVAGFPVRNRIIRLPAIDTQDFLGPDIDVGFRIGKCTQPGMLAVSVELAELLSESPSYMDPIVGQIVGWETLKGVWNDKRYPVIWVDFPNRYLNANDSIRSQKFDPWQQAECPWCKCWELNGTKKALHEDVNALRDIRSRLPRTLGIVDPYIVGDQNEKNGVDSIPLEHREILELLRIVQEHREGVQNQDAGEAAPDAATSAEPKTNLDELFTRDQSAP
jgi:hypothetical protein